ncbi:MAG: DUF2520 domain-containing protein [Ferruginibacter sp.]
MNISVMGTGNVAWVLAGLCVQKGHAVRQVIARHAKAAEELINIVGGSFEHIDKCRFDPTDLLIIALSDNALPDAISGFNFNDTPVVHTAGAVSINVLKNNAANFGVLYPLQSLRKDLQGIPQIPFLVEANNAETFRLIAEFAGTLSDHVKGESEKNRLCLHAAAVMVNNFTNYLYCSAEKFCDDEQVDFNILKPLIQETADRVLENSPCLLQTGPAVRKDIITLDKHLRLLAPYPKLRTMYMRMTDNIMNP